MGYQGPFILPVKPPTYSFSVLYRICLSMWELKRSFHTNRGKYASINESFGPWGTMEKKKIIS